MNIGLPNYRSSAVPASMKSTTDEKKKCFDLWFIWEGRGANRGSVLSAYCKCKGGRDGECKHIAAAMYSFKISLIPEERRA